MRDEPKVIFFQCKLKIQYVYQFLSWGGREIEWVREKGGGGDKAKLVGCGYHCQIYLQKISFYNERDREGKRDLVDVSVCVCV